MPAPKPFPEPDSPSGMQRLPKYLDQEQVRAFLGVISRPRDRALFAFIYLYALRVGEVPLHRRSDLSLQRHRVVIKRKKGGPWSERPLFSRMEELFLDAGIERLPPESPLFPGRLGPLRKRAVQTLFTKYRDLAGIPTGYTCHGLRHAMATHLLDAGEDLTFVQDHLAHRDVRSTMTYAQVTSRNRDAAFARLESSPFIVRPFDPREV